MSIVLKFPLERISRTSSGNENFTGGAEILLFEGVRYEPEKPGKNTKPSSIRKNAKRKKGV